MKVIEPQMLKILHTKASAQGVPLSGTFELSPCCNMNCRMCYVRKSREEVLMAGGERSVEQWISLAEEAYRSGMLFLLLTGGEPFLYPDFRKLYEELSSMGIVLSINTNGTLIDEDTVSWLKDRAPSRVNVTLYGASRETYGRLCQNPDGFDRTIHSIKMLKEAGINVKLNASMTPYNIMDLDEIYQLAESMSVYVQATSYMYPPVRKDERNIGMGDRFSAAEAGRWQTAIDRKRMTEEQFIARAEAMKKNQLLVPDDDCVRNDSEPLRCRAGRSSFWINWKGEMTPCGLMVKPAAYPIRDGFLHAWEQVREQTMMIRLPKKCSNCKKKTVCSVCGASVLAETGDFAEVPEYLCEMTDELIKTTVSVNMEKGDKEH